MFEVLNMSDWQVFQQKNGKADITVLMKLGEDDWLKNPVLEEEKRFAKIFCGLKFRCVEENTGNAVTPWIECKEENGTFACVMKDVPAGGPYQIQQKSVFNDNGNIIEWGGKNTVEHIAVGDIFLIAGQSNAQGWAKGMYFDDIDLNVRSYNDGKWNVATQSLGNNGFHSPFLVFGKMLSKKLGYPIGLIPRAVGGSTVSTWVCGGCHTEKVKKEAIEDIKAILWYQGCEEAMRNTYDTYEEKFMDFVNTMRTHFSDDKLPIITFQLNRLICEDGEKEEVSLGWENLRNVQREIAEKHENIYLIPTIDLMTMSDFIHNSVVSHTALGQRCALYALDRIYGKDKFRAPEFSKAVKASEKSLKIEFENVLGNLEAFSVSAKNLPILLEDENGINGIEKYEIQSNIITIFTERELQSKTKIKIHYGANPHYVIIDSDTQLPVVCIKNITLTDVPAYEES